MLKDLSEMYLLDPARFKDRLEALLQSARPISELRQEALSAEARECFSLARPLLHDRNLMERLKEVVAALGYAGDPRPALITFVGITSRLLPRPLNLAYISPSSAGKKPRLTQRCQSFPATRSTWCRPPPPGS